MKIENEICKCKLEFPDVLQYQLSEYCIVCSNCNHDKEISLTEELNKAIIEWSRQYHRVYREWLNSDSLVEELTNPLSDLNKKGLCITAELNANNLTYYWLHTEEGNGFENCPKCDVELVIVNNEYSNTHQVCDHCRVLINSY